MRFAPRLLFAAFVLSNATCDGSKDSCPGQCAIDAVSPSMTIETADGRATIAKASIVSGPCSHLLVRSEGEAGMQTGYAAVRITYHGSTSIPPLCLVEVTSLAGESAVVTTSVTATSYTQPCCPTGSCCPRATEVGLHHRVTFDQAVQTVAFDPAFDGGAPDAGEDAHASGDGPEHPVDVSDGIDEGGLDGSPAWDGASVDGTGDTMDVASDLAQDAPALPLDAAPTFDGALDL
jgi:hypothetical protein